MLCRLRHHGMCALGSIRTCDVEIVFCLVIVIVCPAEYGLQLSNQTKLFVIISSVPQHKLSCRFAEAWNLIIVGYKPTIIEGLDQLIATVLMVELHGQS